MLLRSLACFLIVTVTAHFVSACASKNKSSTVASATAPPPPTYTVTVPLLARSGADIVGTVTFTESEGVVAINAVVSGLTPNTSHGFHIHEKGDCAAADASSADGHFNPVGANHGSPISPSHHAGDFGNLQADSTGTVNTTYTVTGITLVEALPHSIANRAVILHEKVDDFVAQPNGNAGGRIACGVVVAQAISHIQP